MVQTISSYSKPYTLSALSGIIWAIMQSMYRGFFTFVTKGKENMRVFVNIVNIVNFYMLNDNFITLL